MRTLTLLLSLSLLAVAAVGCTTPSESNDDPTSGAQGFLEACEADAACADDLTCESGVCTRACRAEDRCDAPDAAGYCDINAAAPSCQPVDPSCTDPGTPPDGSCVEGHTFGLEPDANGCPQWGCFPDVCPAPAPFPGECAEGFDIGEVLDADGCPRLDCVPNDCPVINIPQCPAGQEVQQTTDADGCPRLFCVPDDCPPIAAPPADFCPEGQILVQIEGPNGCPDWGCAPVSCPPVAEPQCEEGQEILVEYDEAGCAFPYCSPLDCPPVAAPPADSCPEGQRVIQTTGPNSCPDWACTAEGCEDVEEPELCFDGQPPHRRGLTPNGCTILTCDAERSFDCGPDMACSFDTEYCSVVVPGVEGASTSYSCSALPDTCLDAPSCDCLAEAGAWPENAGSCEDGGGPPGSATLTVTLFAP